MTTTITTGALVKKHKNKKGEWAVCRATQRACRYGGDNEHRYEPANHTPVTPQPVVPVVDEPENLVEVTEQQLQDELSQQQPNTYYINPDRYEEFTKKIETLNKRLTKAGVEEVFKVNFIEEKLMDSPDGDENKKYLAYVVELSYPQYAPNGWEFLASVDELKDENTDETEYIINKTPQVDKDLNVRDIIELKPGYCQHCGKVRHRNKTFIIRHQETGEVKQIGSNCLTGFLGVQPQLWLFESDKIETQAREHGAGFFSRMNCRIPTKKLIALALAASKGGTNYQGNNSDRPTKHIVSSYLFGNHKEVQALEESYPDLVTPEQYDGLVETIMEETRFDGSSDYERNMRTLLAKEHTDARHIGYIVSTVMAYNRQQQKQELIKEKKQRLEKAKGFIGQPNEKVHNIEATIIKTHKTTVPGYGYYDRDKDMNIITLRTPDGKQVKWFTTSEKTFDYEEGKKLNIVNALVKKHEHNDYTGDEETVLRITKFEEKE